MSSVALNKINPIIPFSLFCLFSVSVTVVLSLYRGDIPKLGRTGIAFAVSFFGSMPFLAFFLYRSSKKEIPNVFDFDNIIRYLKKRFSIMGLYDKIYLYFSSTIVLIFTIVSFVVPIFIDGPSYPTGSFLFLGYIFYACLALLIGDHYDRILSSEHSK